MNEIIDDKQEANEIVKVSEFTAKEMRQAENEGEEIEHHLFKTDDGRYKRFFDREDIERIFKDWDSLFAQEETMGRYEKEKIVWKCAVRVKK